MSNKNFKPGMRAEASPVDEAAEVKVEETETTNVEVEETKTAEVEEPTTEFQEPQATEKKVIVGLVSECVKLRVRKQPNTNAKVMCEIELGDKVVVDEEESTKEFYKVYTEAGVEGFCMKKYIDINQ